MVVGFPAEDSGTRSGSGLVSLPRRPLTESTPLRVLNTFAQVGCRAVPRPEQSGSWSLSLIKAAASIAHFSVWQPGLCLVGSDHMTRGQAGWLLPSGPSARGWGCLDPCRTLSAKGLARTPHSGTFSPSRAFSLVQSAWAGRDCQVKGPLCAPSHSLKVTDARGRLQPAAGGGGGVNEKPLSAGPGRTAGACSVLSVPVTLLWPLSAGSSHPFPGLAAVRRP